ncbi:MAG TPA: carbon-nitrogen hydrolase family protein [Phycisphaerae bacterium]|nr:carbon-nitrogen hydrolase family protein [Phycisphaerae bacterium]
MRIALAQMYCRWGDVAGNLRRMAAHVRDAAARHAELVVFPECSAHGMWKDHMVRLAAESPDGPIARRMGRCARRHRIAVGFGLAEKTASKPFNSYVLIGPDGRTLGVYRKNFVTPLERDFFRRDSRRPVFRLGRLRVGIAICADCCHRELLAGYARRGVDLVLMPHAWDADPILKGGRIASFRSTAHMVDVHARGLVMRYRTHKEMLDAFVGRLAPICRRQGLYGAFVNQVGQPHPLIPFVGPSFVLAPSGETVVRSTSKKEALILADIPDLSR